MSFQWASSSDGEKEAAVVVNHCAWCIEGRLVRWRLSDGNIDLRQVRSESRHTGEIYVLVARVVRNPNSVEGLHHIPP